MEILAVEIQILSLNKLTKNKWLKGTKSHVAHTLPHLYGVMQGWGSRVKGQILEGLDLRCLPSSCCRPADCQHVVWKLLAEHQGWGVWLWLQYRVPLYGKICSLTQTNGERKTEKEEEKTERQRGAGSKAGTWRDVYSSSLIAHAFEKWIWIHHASQALMEIELN